MNFLHCRVSLWSGFECEVFFLTVYVELDFSFSDINVGIGSAQKWPSKDDGYFGVRIHVQYHEVYWHQEISDLDWNVLGDAQQISNRLIR